MYYSCTLATLYRPRRNLSNLAIAVGSCCLRR